VEPGAGGVCVMLSPHERRSRVLVLGVWPGVDERREELGGDGVRHLKRAVFVSTIEEQQWLEEGGAGEVLYQR
jgi:hypothetical protein